MGCPPTPQRLIYENGAKILITPAVLSVAVVPPFLARTQNLFLAYLNPKNNFHPLHGVQVQALAIFILGLVIIFILGYQALSGLPT